MDQSTLLTLLVVRGAALVLAVVLARLLVALALAGLARAAADPERARRLGDLAVRVGPRIARGAVTAAIGVGIGVSGAGLATAGPVAPPEERVVRVPVLDRVIEVATPVPLRVHAPASPAPSRSTSARVHVVRTGESLWSIARSALGPGATTDAVATSWPRWYAANRAVVGTDPGLLHPGQLLRAPATESRR